MGVLIIQSTLMKKYLILALALYFSAVAFAKPVIPAGVKSSLMKLYPNVHSVKWDAEGKDFEASFSVNKVKNSVLFDAAGTVIETEAAIPKNSLPAEAIAYVTKHYGTKNLKDAAKITDAKGVVIFEAGVKAKDILFDANGNFLREVKG